MANRKPIRIHKHERDAVASEHYWFTTNASNGKVLTTSETYPKLRNAVKAIHSMLCSLYSPPPKWEDLIEYPRPLKNKKIDAS